jgi:hypothetical protein
MGVGGELTFLKLNKILAFCGANCLLTVNEGDGDSDGECGYLRIPDGEVWVSKTL